MLLQVKVKTRSKRSELNCEPDGTWIARLKSPPVDGRANEELIGLVAAHFRRPRSAISIKSGTRGRLKTLKLEQ